LTVFYVPYPLDSGRLMECRRDENKGCIPLSGELGTYGTFYVSYSLDSGYRTIGSKYNPRKPLPSKRFSHPPVQMFRTPPPELGTSLIRNRPPP